MPVVPPVYWIRQVSLGFASILGVLAGYLSRSSGKERTVFPGIGETSPADALSGRPRRLLSKDPSKSS
jgi:hypothetical protein